MKIEFDGGDERVIEAMRRGDIPPVIIGYNGNFSLNFKVSDWPKASNFIDSIFYDKELVEMLKDKAGLEVTAVNSYTAIPTGDIKNQLQQVIDYIDAQTDQKQF